MSSNLSLSPSLNSQAPQSYYQTHGYLHLSATRWFLLFVGCVFPEIAGGLLILQRFPAISVLLFASAIATSAFIFVTLRRQKCTVRLFPNKVEIQTAQGIQTLNRKRIQEIQIIKEKWTGVSLSSRDEIQFVELANPEEFVSEFRKHHE